ncbi:MAG: uracil-DNA glycosylase family protein [Bacteroidales bacterium]|nr:uracil-DNA glycosylase family protein [Bacteroidales bacterium]
MTIETHPLAPFLPADGEMLFLGSFPPPKARWSMDFFYPNWINDFWRIMGEIHFADKTYFEVSGKKCFDKERIVGFCREARLAFFDTARKVCRQRDNASDDFLEILEPTDVWELLAQMPRCQRVVTTGGKASEELSRHLTNVSEVVVAMPRIGSATRVSLHGREVEWWRMPSSSRAYPLALAKKVDFYRRLFG